MIEKIIKALQDMPTEGFIGDLGNHDLVRSVVDVCCESIEQIAAEYNNGWIPVSERLPVANKVGDDKQPEYLVCDDYGNMFICKRLIIYENEHWNYCCVELKRNIIAWQPLPEKYNPDSVNVNKIVTDHIVESNKTITNADRIRSMTDEQLVYALQAICIQEPDTVCNEARSCSACKREWLQAESEAKTEEFVNQILEGGGVDE